MALVPGSGGRKGLPSKRASYVSLDHLTNFSLPPRQQHASPTPRRSKKPLASPVWNKEKFVNAQYRFVMKPTEDYTVHFADPDIYFEWSDILQVIIPPSTGDSTTPESDINSCPICLSSPPVAPRVTKCGHIFCFPCILRYLELGETSKWNRCPICFDSVAEHHLKCVRWAELPTDGGTVSPQPEATLKMRLIERPHITTMALPRSFNWPSDLLPPHQAPFHFLPDVSTFSKFMVATPDYLISNLSQELDALEEERKLLTSGLFRDDTGLIFVQRAETKVQHQLEKAVALGTPTLQTSIKAAQRLMQDQAIAQSSLEAQKGKWKERDLGGPIDGTPDALLAVQAVQGVASSSSPPRHMPIQPPPRGPKSRKNVNPAPPPSSSSYFFYQAANGAPLFLHPFDSRILLSHFKSYADVPDEIEFPTTTLTYTTSTINDEVRRRYKYLSHLPEGADVVFVETGWELESIVGAEGLKPFEASLKLRQGKRKEKEKKEERARLRAEEKDRDATMQAVTTWVPTGRDLPIDRAPTPPLVASAPINIAVPQGAWGSNRSAAIRAAPTQEQAQSQSTARRQQQQSAPVQQTSQVPEEDTEWELAIDKAWQELDRAERNGRGGAGGKKKAKKLVILSSGRGRY